MENYYVRCVFCLTGTENTVIRRIEAQGLGHAISPRKIQPMKIQGQWIDRETLLMPGYVFIYGDTDKPMHALRATEGVIRVLTYGGQDNDGYLKNEDLDFALRIRRQEGLLGKMEAVQEGDFVRITDGALREMQGKVIAMNRHRHTVQIEMAFLGDTRRIWLGYEVTEKIPEASSRLAPEKADSPEAGKEYRLNA